MHHYKLHNNNVFDTLYLYCDFDIICKFTILYSIYFILNMFFANLLFLNFLDLHYSNISIKI